MGDDLYGEIAQELGLDIAQFDRDRASEAAQAAIARDLALASELRLNSTPTFLMNDLLIPGVVPADFLPKRWTGFKPSSSNSHNLSHQPTVNPDIAS